MLGAEDYSDDGSRSSESEPATPANMAPQSSGGFNLRQPDRFDDSDDCSDDSFGAEAAAALD